MPLARAIAAWGLCAFLVAVVLSLVVTGGQSSVTADTRPPPNVVVVTTDDQEAGSVARSLPRTEARLAAGGTTFTNFVVTTPKCCPSRASYLTGQYGHNNGVLENDPGYEGLELRKNILPAWLHAAGYRTAQVGKFLNGYDRAPGTRKGLKPALGFDEWYAMLRPYRYHDYAITENGELAHYGDAPQDYSTDVLTGYARRFIARSAPKRRPFFLNLSYWAPHSARFEVGDSNRCEGSAIPSARDVDAFAGESAPRPPSFDERDISDKPPWIRNQPRLDGSAKAGIERAYRCRLESLRAVDRGVSRIYDEIKRHGELEDTVFIFTSDNGYFQGEHRLPFGKGLPYEEAIRVPLIVNVPDKYGGSNQPARSGEPVANIDLAPTILDIARASSCWKPGKCRALDGRSMLPLLRGQPRDWPRDRGIEIESYDANHNPCAYVAIRTARYLYAEYDQLPGSGACKKPGTGQRELYDLGADPFQLQNLHPSPAIEAELKSRLERLRSCSGSAKGGREQTGTGLCE